MLRLLVMPLSVIQSVTVSDLVDCRRPAFAGIIVIVLIVLIPITVELHLLVEFGTIAHG